MSNNSTACVTKLNSLIGGFAMNFCLFPPAALLLPIWLLSDCIHLMMRISPIDAEVLLAAATDTERELVADAICKAKGRPTVFALCRLSMKLETKAKHERELAALDRLGIACK